MPTISCLKSPALFPLLTPAVLISNRVPSWSSCYWKRWIWTQPQNNVTLFGNLRFTCRIHAQESPQLSALALWRSSAACV